MMLTTKGQYAVIAILDIASRSVLDPVTLTQISRAQNISVNYLEQIFVKLRLAGLVVAVRGPGGGYMINVDINQIKIADILNAVEERIKITRCSKHKTKTCLSNTDTKCMSHGLWKGLERHIVNYCAAISIGDIISGRVDYDIS